MSKNKIIKHNGVDYEEVSFTIPRHYVPYYISLTGFLKEIIEYSDSEPNIQGFQIHDLKVGFSFKVGTKGQVSKPFKGVLFCN